jgi:hypothetical protein
MRDTFLFIATNNLSLVQRVNKLFAPTLKVKNISSYHRDVTILLFYDNIQGGIVKHSYLNSKNNTISTTNASNISKYSRHTNWIDQHELHSFVIVDDDKITLTSDPLGVFTIYYFELNGTVILSDNIFLIANILEANISIEALFDSVIFKKPFGKNTWYERIYCLQAGEVANYIFNNGHFTVMGGTNWEELFYSPQKDYIKAFSTYFEEYAANIFAPIILALSAGSDSRTVLAGLLNNNENILCLSWGGSDYLETQRIKRLVKEFDLNWKLIDFSLLIEKYEYFTRKSLFDSNGLMPASHLYYFKSQTPSGSHIFEGYGGSEFVKGELSEGMYTPLQYEIIVNNRSLEDALHILYGDLPNSILQHMWNYYTSNYSQYIEPINSDKGRRIFLEYLFRTLPAKIFGGIFGTAKKFDLQLYEPYFSPHILSSIFSNKMGVVWNNSIAPDFSGPVKALKPQALILKQIHPSLYTSVLDRNVKYSEWDDFNLTIYIKRKVRSQLDKLVYRNSQMRDQVDYQRIKKPLISRTPNIQNVFPNYDFENNKNPFGLGEYIEIIGKCRNTEVVNELFYEQY